MRDVNEDSEYRSLKERIKSRETDVIIFGAVSALGAIALGAAFLALNAGFMGAAIVSGVIGAATAAFGSYKSFRASQDVRFDTEEMNARRDAVNLSRAIGVTKNPEEVAVGYAMGKRREDDLRRQLKQERAKPKGDDGWVDYVTSSLPSSNLQR